MLRGSVGVDPSEVAIDFITSYHTHFSGGIFWIDCQWPEMIRYSIENIEKVSGTVSLHDSIYNHYNSINFLRAVDQWSATCLSVRLSKY